MKKKKPDIGAFVLVLTLLINALTGIPSAIVNNTQGSAPPIPKEHSSNICFRSVNTGSCRLLRGDINITVVFVDDAGSKWDDAGVNDCSSCIKNSCNWLEKRAKEYGVELDLTEKLHFTNITIKNEYKDDDDDSPWVFFALRKAGVSLRQYLKIINKYDKSENPVIFCFNKPGRANAVSYLAEHAILYNNYVDTYTFAHELLHLFGAVDYYYCDEIIAASDKYFPDSIMRTADSFTIDELTAFIIGWRDTLSKKAMAFLSETDEVTMHYLSESKDDNVFSGHKTAELDDGTYTGDYVNGWWEGQGKFTWNGGMVYEGEFAANKAYGNGRLTWADGRYFEGVFTGFFDATGIFYDLNGKYFEGSMKMLKMWDGTAYDANGVKLYEIKDGEKI